MVRLALLAGLAVACVMLVQAILAAQQVEQRTIAYAATATHIAVPSPTSTTGFLPEAATSTPQTIATTGPSNTFLVQPIPSLPDAPLPATALPEMNAYNLINILVLGSDRYSDQNSYRTDVIVIVSINQSSQTVSLLSIPRDLYVYIPGWGMERINAAELYQTRISTTRHPLGLLAETIEYNLGLRIDHLARVDFDRFEQLIDLLGGVDVPVDCAVSGFQLAEQGWTPFTLEPGFHHMDGALALWYVRQRVSSSDFDRNRRQQIMLRALGHSLLAKEVLASIPALWGQLTQMVETDLSLETVLGLVPMALNLDASRIESHFLGPAEVNPWQSPSGASVLVIDSIPFAQTLQRFLTPPIENQLVQEQARVQVLNGSNMPDADRLAAARLEWYGLAALPLGSAGIVQDRTTIYDYTGRVKGSSLGSIEQLLGASDGDVYLPRETRQEADFTVVIGNNYEPCVIDPWRSFPQVD